MDKKYRSVLFQANVFLILCFTGGAVIYMVSDGTPIFSALWWCFGVHFWVSLGTLFGASFSH